MKAAAATRTSRDQARRSHVGNVAERIAADQHKALAFTRVAYLYRVPTEMALVRRVAKLEAIHKARATADFIGHMADGRGHDRG